MDSAVIRQIDENQRTTNDTLDESPMSINHDEVCSRTEGLLFKIDRSSVDFLSKKVSSVPIRTHQIKFVVDNMLHGLGRELRLTGCDAIILGNEDAHTDAIRVSGDGPSLQNDLVCSTIVRSSRESNYSLQWRALQYRK